MGALLNYCERAENGFRCSADDFMDCFFSTKTKPICLFTMRPADLRGDFTPCTSTDAANELLSREKEN